MLTARPNYASAVRLLPRQLDIKRFLQGSIPVHPAFLLLHSLLLSPAAKKLIQRTKDFHHILRQCMTAPLRCIYNGTKTQIATLLDPTQSVQQREEAIAQIQDRGRDSALGVH